MPCALEQLMRRAKQRLAFVRFLLAALLLVVPASAGADSAGQVLYVTYCASCHGVDGRGNGPVAGSLVKQPADLTKLDKRFGVPISRSKLSEFIDGRAEVIAHGPRDMPVWGRLFKEEVGPGLPGTEDTTRRAIDVIVDYLISIQSIQGATGGRPNRGVEIGLDLRVAPLG